MKKILFFASFFLAASAAFADEPILNEPAVPADSLASMTPAEAKPAFSLATLAQKFDPTVKFGGYIIGQFTANDTKGADTHTNFNLRLIRLYLNGYAFQDFYYRLQMEVNGQPGVDKGPRVIDAFIEWQKFDELRVKLGEFKRSFGFENPMAPLTVGHGAYSQATTKFLFNDRCGAHATGGRDVGIQLQGDFFPAADGHKWLHYQVGLFNGQGINHSDKDHHKDLIGGIWVSPVKNLRIGAFGWDGRYTNENYNAENPRHQRQVKRVRWGTGVDYEADWVCRAEYYSSVGGVVTDVTKPNRSDAWYATVGVPVTKGLKIYGKWDCYRDNKEWNSLRQVFGVTANYWMGKNFLLQAGYNFISDRASADHYQNTIDLQVAARF